MGQSTSFAPIAEDVAHVRRLRLASFAEATTLLLLLLVAVPLKHAFGYSLGTRIMGSIHGAAFLVYAWSLIAAYSGGGWTGKEMARMGLAAFVPFGGFLNAGLLRRKQAFLAASLEARP